MRALFRGALAGALALAAHASAAAPAFEDRSFEARVGDVRLQARLVEQGKADDERVRVTVPAAMFEPPVRIDDVRDYGGGDGRLIGFLADYWRANLRGDARAVVEAWCPGARERIRRFVANESLFERNRRALEKRPGLDVLGLVRHRETISILQDRGHTVTGVTVRTADGGPCLVDAPADDLELAIIEASFE